MRKTNDPSKSLLATLTLTLALTLSTIVGCGFFDDDDDELGDEIGDTGETEAGGDPAPIEGFRVFPKFMVQDVSAIVTVDAGGLSPEPCVLDDAPEGGYVCDTEELPEGAVSIRVEKDGFDAAVRNPEIVAYQIRPLEVHLSVEGGPTGTWSACTPAGEFESCAELCAAQTLSCAVTSCATEQAQWPVATFESFVGPDCVELIESVAGTCEDPLPGAGVAESLRCCC